MCGGHASAGQFVLPSTLMMLTLQPGCKNEPPVTVDRGEAQLHLLGSQTLGLLRKAGLQDLCSSLPVGILP